MSVSIADTNVFWSWPFLFSNYLFIVIYMMITDSQVRDCLGYTQLEVKIGHRNMKTILRSSSL